MLYKFDVKKQSICNYNNKFLQKINNRKNKIIIINFSLLIFFLFFIVNFISLTPTLIFLCNKSNSLFKISLIVSIILIYIIIKNFFNGLNYMQILSQNLLVNDFFKDGYNIILNDTSKYLQIQNSCIKMTFNLSKDFKRNNINIFKDFISITFNNNTIFLPKEDSILYILKSYNLI